MKTGTLITTFLGLCLLSSAFAQGDLTPPGAPAPTMKSLDQVEPRTALPSGSGLAAVVIDQPGSYYFTGDRETSNTAFTIRTNDVTIDLNGYTLKSLTGTFNAAILVAGGGTTNYHSITIRNGTISGFGFGVELYGASGCHVENVTIVGTGYGAFLVSAEGATADGNVFRECAALGSGAGFSLGGANGNCRGNILTHCAASACTGSGFALVGGSGSSPGNVSGNLLQDCTANGNQAYGFDLAASGGGQCQGNQVVRCLATFNGSQGIDLSAGTAGRLIGNVVQDCQSVSNYLSGIAIISYGGPAAGNKIARNTCIANRLHGISTDASTGGMVVNNLCVTNGGGNYLLGGADFNGPIVTTTGTLGTNGAAASPWANFSN